MDKWFPDKLEKDDFRNYTKKRLRRSFLSNLYRGLSVTNWLIITNVFIFFAFSLLVSFYGEENIVNLLALQANSFFAGKFWTVLTSMFMHAGFIHLFVNMFSLFFIGNFIERLIGRKRFFWFYIISGVFAGLFFVVLSYFLGSVCIVNFLGGCLGEKIFSNPATFAVGASGAIFALAGLLAVLTPKNKVYLITGPLIAIIMQAILSAVFPSAVFVSGLNVFINLYIIFSIFAMFSFNPKIRRIAVPLEMQFWVLPIIAIVPLVIIGLFFPLPIGNMAHLGGLIAGFVYAAYLKKKYKKKTEMIRRIFSK